MNSALALILVVSAHITVAQTGPDMPDDFNRSGDTATVVFSAVASGPSQLVRTTGTRKITERWLVSEDWCANCPAAKKRFLAAGNDGLHIITIAEAKRRHKKSISGVPTEYTIETSEPTTWLQPARYRSVSTMTWSLDGSSSPGKVAILKHLRNGGPHHGKHWQAWHLESWKTEQLYALHDDDHTDSVPVFDDAPQSVEAVVGNAPQSIDTVAAVLALHLADKTDEPQPALGSLLNIDVAAPQSMLDIARKLLIQQEWKSETAGVSVSWKGGDRSVSIGPKGITIKPGASVTLRKSVLRLGATLDRVAFEDSLSWVTLELSGAPDLTVRFTP